MKNKQIAYKPVLGIIILIAIALLTAWYFRRPATNNDVNNTSPTSQNGAPVTIPGDNDQIELPTAENSIIVSDQRVGSTIDIDQLQLMEPGYVVIKTSAAGQPGTIVARSNLLSAGTKQDLVISYSAKAGTYYAVLYKDDGDGKFDAAKDIALNSTDGQVMTTFMVVQ
jgi:hypothetical protein